MVVRVQAQDGSWVWLYMVLQLQPGEIPISSNNYIIRYFSASPKTKSSFIQRKAAITVAFSFFFVFFFLPLLLLLLPRSEAEAWAVRQQLTAEQNQLTLVLGAGASQQESLSLQSPETLSSPDQVFTPGSSGLSGQSFDFSTDRKSVV